MRSFRWLLSVVLVTASAHAHDADIIYVALDGEGEELRETVTLTAATLSMLAPVDADHDHDVSRAELELAGPAVSAGVWDQMELTSGGQRCTRSQEQAFLRDGYVELSAIQRCGAGDLRQDFRFLSLVPTNYRVVVGRQVEGERGRVFAQGTFTSVAMPRPKAQWLVPARVVASIPGGARSMGSLLALAFLACAVIGLRSRRDVIVAVSLFAVGFAAGELLAVRLALATTTVLLAINGLASARVSLRGGAVLGGALGLGSVASVGAASENVGSSLGALALTLGLGVVAMPLVRLLQRRPVWLARARAVALVVGLAAAIATLVTGRVF